MDDENYEIMKILAQTTKMAPLTTQITKYATLITRQRSRRGLGKLIRETQDN